MAKILIVEDDIDLCEVYQEVLEQEGHVVFVTQTSSQALEFLIRSGVTLDLVFLDMHLPGVSGLVVLNLIRRLPRLSKTKVVVVSGYPDMANQAMQEWDADQFLCKPVTVEQLKEAVSLVEKPKSEE
jgi:CheY-like chemotaxis protein